MAYSMLEPGDQCAGQGRFPPLPMGVFSPDAEGTGPQAELPGRVLIVEDEYFVALVSEDALLEAGFVVVGMATTAEQAIEMAEAERPDVVLMDIRLAGQGDGIAAAAEIRARFGIPSVFATAQGDQGTRDRGERDARPLGWISKPFTATDVATAVAAAVALARHRASGS